MSKISKSTFTNPDLERRCLGFLLSDGRSEVEWSQIADLIPTGSMPATIDNEQLFSLGADLPLFHDPVNHEVFAHIARKLNRGDAVTPDTISESLDAIDRLAAIGGPLTIENLAESASQHVIEEFGNLTSLWVSRKAYSIAETVADRLKAPEADPREVCADVAAELASIADDSARGGPREIGEIAVEVADEILAVASGEIEFSGLKTPFDLINKASGGLHPGELVILAARPSVGKSILGQQFAVYQALDEGNRAAIMSLEMSAREIQWRNIAARQGVKFSKIKHNELGMEVALKIRADAEIWDDQPLIIDDRAHTTAALLQSRVKALKARYPDLKLLVLDYLQLVSIPGKSTRNNEIADVSRTLKLLAKDLDIAVVALSQLSRDGDKAGRPPRLSDLRDSGAIEQDADVVYFLHRQGETTDPNGVDFAIRKQRNGELIDWTPIHHVFDHYNFEEIKGAASGTFDGDFRAYQEAEGEIPQKSGGDFPF